MTEKNTFYSITRSGGRINYENPDPASIILDDVAHALSQICRFCGQTKVFYSVAQHCVYVSEIVAKETQNKQKALFGLLHDMAEAYIGDLPRGLKGRLPEYKAIENRVLMAGLKKLGCINIPNTIGVNEVGAFITREIKDADGRICITEAKQLMNIHIHNAEVLLFYKTSLEGVDMEIIPWTSGVAKRNFLNRYEDLTK